jgi:4-diphosphocytidyl-2-C-methyl-D-erythritol kinase
MTRAPAPAKINLALVVGPAGPDGKHEVATVLQRVDVCDRIELSPSSTLVVDGFAEDTIVASALRALARAAGVAPRWRVRIVKKIPVAAGLGGGSSDGATALRLANATLPDPLTANQLHELAAGVGADVPFFLSAGTHLATGSGGELEPLELPQDFWVLLVLPHGAWKESTASVYEAFDARRGSEGFDERRAALRHALAHISRARDFAALPRNDLAASPLAAELEGEGAFRADVSGAGPTIYGLFSRKADAQRARRALRGVGKTWLTVPCWYP